MYITLGIGVVIMASGQVFIGWLTSFIIGFTVMIGGAILISGIENWVKKREQNNK